jgi:BirA family transcriptional regulator, biotin operon repressor / biotin---[acetyl-CoA-carboxylase] ligase
LFSPGSWEWESDIMTQPEPIARYLDPLGLSAWRFFTVVGSTNDVALAWAHQDAPDESLVVANAQTAGRGRDGRHWVTEPGGSLAFSLVLRPSGDEGLYFSRFTALAALGLIQALSQLGLKAAIKWPNDILLGGKKVAGVLVEADWQADRANAVVIGLGVNVSAGSVPPAAGLRYPATAVEAVLGSKIDRWALLADILSALRDYRRLLQERAFVDAWNAHLAGRGAWVSFQVGHQQPEKLKVIGVSADGQLALARKPGEVIYASTGEIVMIGELPAS